MVFLSMLMFLNLTLEVYLSLSSVALTFFAAIIIYRQQLKNPDKALIFMSLTYIFLGLYLLFNGLGYLLLDKNISMIKNLFLVLISIFITMTMNLMIYGKLQSPMLPIISFFSAFAIAVYMLPISENIQPMVYDNGDPSLQNVGINRLIIAVLFLYIIILILNFSLKIYRHSPLSLRRNASLFFFGNVIIAIAALTFFTGLSLVIPGIVELLVSTGILVSSIGLILAPQILYVLPFNAIKLSIINSYSGISVYNYYWRGNLNESSDQLFGAAFMAITNFMQESVGEGGIQEVKLDDATMTISKSANQAFYYVVIASKPSYVLKKGLELFAKEFNRIYGELLSKESNYDFQQFQNADHLIPLCFPYIPKR
jgi:hypothetical protein